MVYHRSKNFTEREKSVLLKIIEKYKNIIENKSTTASTIVTKHKTWEAVSAEFNRVSEFPRSAKQLLTAYSNLKRVTRKNVLNKTQETGQSSEAAPYQQPTLSELSNQLLALIGRRMQQEETAVNQTVQAYVKEEINSTAEKRVCPHGVVSEDTSGDDDDEEGSDSGDTTGSEESERQATTNANSEATTSRAQDRPVSTPGAKKQGDDRRSSSFKSTRRSSGHLRNKFYKKKLESAIVEKQTNLLNLKNAEKQSSVLDYELKIKKLEYQKLVLSSND